MKYRVKNVDIDNFKKDDPVSKKYLSVSSGNFFFGIYLGGCKHSLGCITKVMEGRTDLWEKYSQSRTENANNKVVCHSASPLSP